MLHRGVTEVLMAGEEGLPAAYGIKVKDGQVLRKHFPFRYRVIGPLASASAGVDPLGGVPTLVVLVGGGISCLHVIGSDVDEIERARAWAHRFNELSHAGRQDEPGN
jgi:hypothetical protein